MNIPHPYQLYSAEESRALDERTINEFGIDGFTLMEIAGTRAADFILSKISKKDRGLICCGRGNNAGDALVAARILCEHGITFTILFVDGKKNLSSDCRKNLELFQQSHPGVELIEDFESVQSKSFRFLVDGMLGTGLNSEVRSPYSEIIEWMNQQDSVVFSMDIPTGLNANNGMALGTTVKADFTLAFGTLKQGFYMRDGFEVCGEIIFCELPFPSIYKNSSTFLLDESWLDESISSSKKRAHKYEGGVVYIIGGSEGLTGAAILAAKSAWSTGVGAVILLTPKGLLPAYEEQLPQIIKKPVGTNDDRVFSARHLEETQTILSEKPGVLLIGPGLGRNEETITFTRQIFSFFDGDIVLDADALSAISQSELKSGSNWILTPHPGELSALLNQPFHDDQDRLEKTKEFAVSNQLTILSKGLPSICASQSGQTFITNYDTRIFARAGFGDVLAGKITGNLLQHNSLELACALALIEGKRKADFVLSSSNTLEPLDII